MYFVIYVSHGGKMNFFGMIHIEMEIVHRVVGPLLYGDTKWQKGLTVSGLRQENESEGIL